LGRTKTIKNAEKLGRDFKMMLVSKEECESIILENKGCLSKYYEDLIDCNECYYSEGKGDVFCSGGGARKIYKYVLMRNNLEEILE
jgi:hypothetical protein